MAAPYVAQVEDRPIMGDSMYASPATQHPIYSETPDTQHPPTSDTQHPISNIRERKRMYQPIPDILEIKTMRTALSVHMLRIVSICISPNASWVAPS